MSANLPANFIRLGQIQLRMVETGNVKFILIRAHQGRAKPAAGTDNDQFHFVARHSEPPIAARYFYNNRATVPAITCRRGTIYLGEISFPRPARGRRWAGFSEGVNGGEGNEVPDFDFTSAAS